MPAMVAQAAFPRRPVADSRRSHGRHRGFASKIRDYIFGSYIDEVLCMVKADNSRYFFSTNDLYSVYALTDSDGNVVERYMFSPYGAVIVMAADGVTVRAESLYGNPWTFTGRRLDGETGLMQYRFRYYDTGLGRFISRDPIGYADGMGLYEYVGAQLTTVVDPFGLTWTFVANRDTNDEHVKIRGVPGDVVRNIPRDLVLSGGDLFQLNPNESAKWLIPTRNPAYVVTGKYDCEYWIPNTILFVWTGEGGDDGRRSGGFEARRSQLESKGFHAEVIRADDFHKKGWQMGANDHPVPYDEGYDTGGFSAKVLDTVADLSGRKALFGWFSMGHGYSARPGGITYKSAGKQVAWVGWDEIGGKMTYGLAWAEAWSCGSNLGKEHILKGNGRAHWFGFTYGWNPLLETPGTGSPCMPSHPWLQAVAGCGGPINKGSGK